MYFVFSKTNFYTIAANSSDTINEVTFSPDVFTFPPDVLKSPDEAKTTSDHLHSNQNKEAPIVRSEQGDILQTA